MQGSPSSPAVRGGGGPSPYSSQDSGQACPDSAPRARLCGQQSPGWTAPLPVRFLELLAHSLSRFPLGNGQGAPLDVFGPTPPCAK